MNALLSRRALLGAGLLLPVLFEGKAARAQGLFGSAQPGGGAIPQTLRAVAVDVQPLLDHGGGGSARLLASDLEAEMRQTFADRLAPGRAGAVLTARITNLFFTDYEGGADVSAFGHNDNIEGDGIVSNGGSVLSTTHVLTELPASYSGAYYLPDIDRRRMRNIAHQFAYWLRREMNV